MFLGFSTFTWVHTILSLVAIVAGCVVVRELFASRTPGTWTTVYISTAVLTSVTGFGFPFTTFLPSHGVGVISLVILAGAIAAYYVFHLAGPWRWIYAATQSLALFFLVFVLIAQLFLKVPALTALAPTQAEPPFAIAQGVNLLLFAVITIAAMIKFRPWTGEA
jgi:hypothetical protein